MSRNPGAIHFECYRFAYNQMLRAFRDNTNHWSSGFESCTAFWANVSGTVGSLIGTLSALLNLMLGDEKSKEQAKENLAKSLASLMNDIKSRGTVWNGAHMNGWVAGYMQSAANWTLQQHLDGKFPDQKSDAGKVAEVLRQTFRQIASLETKGHDPWLKAEWQVQFQAILSASVISLNSLQ